MNRIGAVFLPGLLTVGLLVSCSSPQFSRIDQNRDIYESWPIETKQAVLDGKVDPGMTPEMVRVSWGQPTEVSQSNPGEEIWIYSKGGDDGSVIMPAGMQVGGMPGMIGGGGGTGITMGRGLGPGAGLGLNPILASQGGMGNGLGTPIYTPPTPAEVREVVFRDGVVYRADKP
jgi:hypothetical protein